MSGRFGGCNGCYMDKTPPTHPLISSRDCYDEASVDGSFSPGILRTSLSDSPVEITRDALIPCLVGWQEVSSVTRWAASTKSQIIIFGIFQQHCRPPVDRRGRKRGSFHCELDSARDIERTVYVADAQLPSLGLCVYKSSRPPFQHCLSIPFCLTLNISSLSLYHSFNLELLVPLVGFVRHLLFLQQPNQP